MHFLKHKTPNTDIFFPISVFSPLTPAEVKSSQCKYPILAVLFQGTILILQTSAGRVVGVGDGIFFMGGQRHFFVLLRKKKKRKRQIPPPPPPPPLSFPIGKKNRFCEEDASLGQTS